MLNPLWLVDLLDDIPVGKIIACFLCKFFNVGVPLLIQRLSSLNEFTLSIVPSPIVSDGGSGIADLKQIHMSFSTCLSSFWR